MKKYIDLLFLKLGYIPLNDVNKEVIKHLTNVQNHCLKNMIYPLSMKDSKVPLPAEYIQELIKQIKN